MIRNRNEHINDRDLIQVLSGLDSVALDDGIEDHISECEQCRIRLEEMAAQPDMWQQASSFLNCESADETLLFSARFNVKPKTRPANGEAGSFNYSIESLLESPGHPEMLGRLAHYEIEREIGRGGMGVVLKARDTELNRAVAIKMMAPHLASHGVARQRFAREARAAAAILHPNVIAIHAVSTESKTPWLVMPYILGPSLEQIVNEQGALDERDVVSFSMQIAAGLAAAHCQGVVHRDIKPANVLVESGVGRVVITDFGLARAECDASMTQTGWFAGTPNFMSPEQATGSEIDHRSDLFSLGAVMYYLSTGCLPFRAEGPMAVLEKIRNHSPNSARAVNSRISKTLSDVIDVLLAKNPDDRIQSAAEVHDLLEQFLAYLHHPQAKTKPIVPNISRSRSRSFNASILWLALVLAGVLAIGGILGAIWKDRPAPAPSPAKSIFEIREQYGLQSLGELESDFMRLQQGLLALENELGDPFNTNNQSGSLGWPANLPPSDKLDSELDSLNDQINQIEKLDWQNF